MNEMEMICFQIIAASGGAKTAFMEAIELAKDGKFDEAEAKISEGEENMNAGHGPHFELITKEANGESTPVSLLLIHAEDQMMGAEQFKALAEQSIALYKRLAALEAAE